MTANFVAESNHSSQPFCCTSSAAAGTSARIMMVLDTAMLAVSIIIIRVLGVLILHL